MGSVAVRQATADDVEAITAIQNALIATTTVEWTSTPRTVASRAAWLRHQQAAGHPVLVATDDGGDVVGWASYGEFRDVDKWPGYRFTVEHTVHVRDDHRGTGVGRLLMDELVDRACRAGKHVMVAAVTGENTASIRFHERLGFVEVARLPEVGVKFGRWLDLVLLQRRLHDGPPPPS